MQESVRVCVPRYLQIGKGSISQLPSILSAIGTATRPLIVTDKTMVEIGHVALVTKHLDSHGISYGIFDGTVPDPTDKVISEGLAVLKAGGYDSVIGIGGGSPIDTAKAMAVMSQGSQNILDYRPPQQFNTPGLPIIAIPTTAGTGSEVTHHTVVVHSTTHEKISCRGEAFVPTAAIIDYELTLTMPRRLTADNALDTLTHGIEAYVSAKCSLFSDRMALDCMRLVGQYLERAYNNEEDHEAREGLMLAATLGGLAFSNASIALIHGMSRPLGGIFHVPHGLSNAMLLPQVTEYSLDAALDRYAECGRAIGFASKADEDSVAAQKLVDGLYKYQKNLETPSISEFGIDPQAFNSALEQMADDALRSGAPNNNPRIPTKAEVIKLYQQAW
ncbi:MAG: alcohol dehydrogenase class IV [Saprospiraceae bacterium]|jgi:alcohol dehydrogenase class IV|tara:strand:- start:4125 stop:5291 length:1167 start_codon:yes stop_codon:yes gene_type:complete